MLSPLDDDPQARVVVNTSGVESHINIASVNKWADDVNAREEVALVRKCWTYPPSYIRDLYLGDIGRLANLMGQTPEMTQAGPNWRTNAFDGDQAMTPWAESESSYVCPEITYPEDGEFRDDLILHRAKRYILREQGTPMSPNDIASDCWLECELVRGTIANSDKADANDMEIMASSENEWTVRAGSVTIEMHYEPGMTCIHSAN